MEHRCQTSAGRPESIARKRRTLCGLLTLGLALGLLAAGCARPFYRKKADKEVADILREKDQYPAWKIEQMHVYPDPRARFADLGNTDFPPMPPDDPAAGCESPTPQGPGKSGVRLMESTGYLDQLAAWDTENRLNAAAEAKEAGADETTQSPANLPGVGYEGGESEFPDPLTMKDGARPFLLTLENSVELALFNSREFQDRREDLYLTALPVTVERFAFASQFFATETLIRERLGKLFPAGPSNHWVSSGAFGLTKLFSTGALLMFQFANRTVVELANPNLKHTISQSTIDLDILQPLLRGGGRAVTLEPLTFAERNLLYEIRDYARFRKEFFVNIAAGGNVSGVSVGASRFRVRANSFFTFNGILGAAIRPGRGNLVSLLASGSASPSGFLPTLQNAAQYEIEQNNVATLEGYLRLFRGLAEGPDISQLQVAQVESQLLQSRSTAFQRNQTLRDSLDLLKLQLGVPINLPMEMDDRPVKPLREQFRSFRAILDELKAVRTEAENQGQQIRPAEVRATLRRLILESRLVRGTTFRTEFPRRWATWERRSDQEVKRRLKQFAEELRQLRAARDELEARGAVPESLLRRIDEVGEEIDIGRFEQAIRVVEAQPLSRAASAVGASLVQGMMGPVPTLAILAAEAARGRPSEAYRNVVNLLEQVLGQVRNERVERVKGQWIKAPRVCLNGVDLLATDLETAEATVAQGAIVNRFDLMNVRAILVDAWRQLRVSANALLGTFNVEYHLNSNTPPGLAMPLAFSGSRSRHQLILNGELPIVRILERNAYRTSLLAWERQRRFLMGTEDSIVGSVRSELRALRVLAASYRIQQKAVEVAYLQVESALDTFRAPPPPTGTGGGGGGTAGNAAALTNQLLSSQQTLVRAQNNLISVWVSYLTTRMQLYRDLELMQFDPRGVWIDDVATCECPPDLSPGRQPAGTADRRSPGQ
jgi:hypothetical protein